MHASSANKDMLAKQHASLRETNPLARAVERNAKIDRSADSLSKMESTIVDLFENMTDVMTNYTKRLHSQRLTEFTANFGQIRGDFASIKDGCMRSKDLAVVLNQKSTDLRTLTDKFLSDIEKKMKSEDLTAPIYETRNVNSAFLSRLALAKIADVRTAMAIIALALEEARQLLAETEAQSAEAEVAANEAYIQAQDAGIATEEAHDAAVKKRAAEVEVKRAEGQTLNAAQEAQDAAVKKRAAEVEAQRRAEEQTLKAAQEAHDAAVKKRAAEVEVKRAEEQTLKAAQEAQDAAVKKRAAEVEAQRCAEERTAIAAQEAHDNAVKIRAAEVEAQRRAEEFARQKAEQEKVKKQEEQRRIHEEAMAKKERIRIEEEKMQKERERRNPNNWPKYVYTVEECQFDAGIGCILRALVKDKEMRKDDLQCVKVDTSDDSLAPLTLASNEEIISNVIQLTETRDDQKLTFDEPFSIAIPHCITKIPPVKEVYVKMLQPNGQWIDLPTAEFIYEDNKLLERLFVGASLAFVFYDEFTAFCIQWNLSKPDTLGTSQGLRFREVSLYTYSNDVKFAEARAMHVGTFVVVLRLRTDRLQLAIKGGKTTSSVDPRITFTCEPGTVKQTFNFALDCYNLWNLDVRSFHKVQPVDPGTISDLRAREPRECGSLIASSPFVGLSTGPEEVSTPATLVKPLKVTIPVPQSVAKQSKSLDRAASASRPKSTTRTFAEKEDIQEEELHFLCKGDKTGWVKDVNIALIQTKSKDVIEFAMNKLFNRFLLLRTKRDLLSSAVEMIATLLDRAMSQRYVRLHLRQQSRSSQNTIIACAILNKTEETIKSLSQAGYPDGPSPSNDVIIAEGQTLFLRFRGNIRREAGHGELMLTYNTHMRNQVAFRVNEVDKFAQNGLQCYRGFVQVFTKGMVPNATHEEGRMQSRVEMVHGDVLVAELLVELPKHERDVCTPLYTIRMQFVEGPITEGVLRSLANDMGDEWRDVADQLKIKPTRIQAILRQNNKQENAQTRYDMLIAWAKCMPTSSDKTQVLNDALLSSGRPDLAEDIRSLGDNFRKEHQQNAKTSHLNQAFVKVAKERSVCDTWQLFAKRLGLSNEAVDRIEASSGSNQEKCLASLEEWRNSAGDWATIPILAAELKKIKNYRLSSEVASILDT